MLASCLTVSLVSCDDESTVIENPVVGPNLLVYGLTTSNQLVKFNANKPDTFTSTISITGVGANEKLMSIDFRPATGELYAVSDASKIYAINANTAAARAINSTSFTPAISGSIASIDFNPTVDRIRLVTNTGQNLRINPETATNLLTDGSIATTASIAGVAYTNSRSGATSTTLYDIDATSGKLFKQDPPNNGTLVEVGSLGMTFTGQAAFDISPDNSVALMAATTGSQNMMFTVNLSTGKATNIGALTQKLVDIAIPTDPVAYAVDNSNMLQIFNPGSGTAPVSKTISGLQSGENIFGIDFRPLNGQLFALGSTSRIYRIDLGTGAATQVGSQLSTLLSGTDFGFDFNPSVDRIRVVSNTGQNLRINPADATLIVDPSVNGVVTNAIGAAAYSSISAVNSTTTLYTIDHNLDILYVQTPANQGTQVQVGSLGINIGSSNGFDIGGTSNMAYLLATVGSETKMYNINTNTGAATSVGSFPNPVRGFAIGLGF